MRRDQDKVVRAAEIVEEYVPHDSFASVYRRGVADSPVSNDTWGRPSAYASSDSDQPIWIDLAVTAPRGPVLSPSGRYLAFSREHYRQNRRRLSKHPGVGVFPVRRTWVRDFQAGEVWPLPTAGVPLQWIGDEWLALADGAIVNPRTGERRAGESLIRPNGGFFGYSADGESSAQDRGGILAIRSRATPGHWLHAAGDRQPILTSDEGQLWWSPDGRWVAVRTLADPALYQRRTDAVVLVDAREGRAIELASWDSRQADQAFRHAMRYPARSAQTWSADSRHFVFSRLFADDRAELYLFDAVEGTTARITDDGQQCWSPAIDPSGTRIAYWSGTHSRGQAGPGCHIRVRNLRTGETQIIRPAGDDPQGYGHVVHWMPDGEQLMYDWVADGPPLHGLGTTYSIASGGITYNRSHGGIFMAAVTVPASPTNDDGIRSFADPDPQHE